MAVALAEHSEETLAVTNLMRNIRRWEAGECAPEDVFMFAYHRVFPRLGAMDPPPGVAVFGGPGQPADPRELLGRAAREIPGPGDVDALAAAALAAGADPEWVWAQREAIRDLVEQANTLAAILASRTGEGGGGAAEKAG